MIWFLERGSDMIACEARRNGRRFELTISDGDGSERAEQIDDPSVLVERLVECQLGLRRKGWRILTNGVVVSAGE
jgi:hypothetical protein